MTHSNSTTERSTTPTSTFAELVWEAIDRDEVTRADLARAMDVSVDTVSRMLGEDPVTLLRYRALASCRRLPASFREAFVAWFLRDSGFAAAPVARLGLAELDANKDGRVDGRDAICLEGQVLSKGTAALEALCASIRDGRLLPSQRAAVRAEMKQVRQLIETIEQCLDVEERGGMAIGR
jgi:hypothetical protein